MSTGGIPFLENGIECVCVDSQDPERLAAWWQKLVGGEAHIDSDGDVSLRTGSMVVLFLAVPEPKRHKNRLHFDLRATDFESAVAAALALGAELAPDIYDGPSWQVLRDPEGNEFCILRPRDDTGHHAGTDGAPSSIGP
jgi:hypothetical protein